MKSWALSRACLDRSRASCFSLAAISYYVGGLTTGSGFLSSGYSSGNWLAKIFSAYSASGSIYISEPNYNNIPWPSKLFKSFSTSSIFPFEIPAPAAFIDSTISFACYSSAASLMLNFSSFAGGASATGFASSSVGTSSSFLATTFFLAFLGVTLTLLLLLAAAGFAFFPLAFSYWAFLTSSTDLPDLSSSITSYNIDSWTPSWTT